jgi:hypothetical protein
MGDIREVKGWRHFSLGDRIAFLERYLEDPAARRRYRRASAGLVAFFVLLLAVLGGAASSTVPAQLREGRPVAALLRADWLSSRGREADAIREGLRALDIAARERMPLRTGVLRGREADDRERALRLLEWISRGPAGEPAWSAVLHRAYLARLLLAQNEPRFSLAVSEEVFMIAGDLPETIEDMGIALLLLGRYRGAALAFADARRLAGDGSDRGRRMVRYEAAAKALEEAATAGGEEAWARALRIAAGAGLSLSDRRPEGR